MWNILKFIIFGIFPYLGSSAATPCCVPTRNCFILHSSGICGGGCSIKLKNVQMIVSCQCRLLSKFKLIEHKSLTRLGLAEGSQRLAEGARQLAEVARRLVSGTRRRRRAVRGAVGRVWSTTAVARAISTLTASDACMNMNKKVLNSKFKYSRGQLTHAFAAIKYRKLIPLMCKQAQCHHRISRITQLQIKRKPDQDPPKQCVSVASRVEKGKISI